MSLQETDRAAAAVAKAPRVSLGSIESKIRLKYIFSPYDVGAARGDAEAEPLKTMTICILVMENGYTVLGKSAPASPENFNWELGAKLAYEDCIRQLWPMEGYLLRERLSARAFAAAGLQP